MKILYYSWTENSTPDIISAFETLGHTYTEISCPLDNYDEDLNFEEVFYKTLTQQNYDCIYTFNYFPIISKIANQNQIPYICWVYDCPHLTLYSHTISNPYNYLFIFDRNLLEIVRSLGAKHAFHMPLAVNTTRLNQQLNLSGTSTTDTFSYDVSFVGSLYENNMFDQINYLPDQLRGYFDGVMHAQQKIWGYNFLSEVLNDAIVADTLKYIQLETNPLYAFRPKDIFITMLNQKITCNERIFLLDLVSRHFSCHLFSNTNRTIEKCIMHGPISYTDEMPSVFSQSKINLNISLRSIYSGIPLRCMDILGCGGFLLTNYQPELAEFFVPDEDFVYFESPEDMIEKINYYQSHQETRKNIAHNGWQKIQKNFTYEIVLDKIFSICLK